MNQILGVLKANDIYLIGLLALLVAIFLVNIISAIKIYGLSRKYNKFIKSFKSDNIEDTLLAFMKRVEDVDNKADQLEKHCLDIDNHLLKCIQKAALVRFNAFEDMGSDLSFAIALLDGYDNGVILNGIYGRENSTIFAKPISKGKAQHVLSEEEEEALEAAKKPTKRKGEKHGE
jgi:hypothetical protein